MDNGPEFISKALQAWMQQNGIKLKHIEPGSPTQNAYIERFNRSFREDVLDAYLFNDLAQIRELAWNWMTDYNENHPHKALKGMSPAKYSLTFSNEGTLFREGKRYKEKCLI